jgi:hypothetical protein
MKFPENQRPLIFHGSFPAYDASQRSSKGVIYMKIETLDVVANISSVELQDIIDALDIVVKEPEDIRNHIFSKIGTCALKKLEKIVNGLNEFKGVASKAHPSGYHIRPNTKKP